MATNDDTSTTTNSFTWFFSPCIINCGFDFRKKIHNVTIMSDSEFFEENIIPFVIIASILLIVCVAILICLLCNKKNKAGGGTPNFEQFNPHTPVILENELMRDEREMCEIKKPVLLKEDLINNGSANNSTYQSGKLSSSKENEFLLHQHEPVQMNIFPKSGNLARPAPAYKKRQVQWKT